MTFDRKRSKGDSDGGKTHLETSAHGPGIDDYGKMQRKAPIETSDSGTETAALPPAAEPVAPEASTPTASEAAPVPTPPLAEETAALPLPAETTEALIRRGDQLLGVGDIVAARSAYERAAEDGNRVAAMGVAKTYDPIFLAQIGVRGLRGDPARAALWYRLAAAAGDREAQQRLTRLRAQYPQ